MAAWVMVLIHQLSRCPSIKPPRVSSLKMERAQLEIPFGLLGTICGRLSCNSGLGGRGGGDLIEIPLPRASLGIRRPGYSWGFSTGSKGGEEDQLIKPS